MKFARQARKEQSQLEHGQLMREVKAWLERREHRDSKHQYRTQLEAIGTILTAALQQLETALAALDLSQPEETVYSECRLFDLRTVWLRRVWEFFKEKFDQRDDPEAGPLLQAADEVVWSCYWHICLQLKERDDFKPRPAVMATWIICSENQLSEDSESGYMSVFESTTLFFEGEISQKEARIQSTTLFCPKIFFFHVK